jgi:hypothetical protein
MVKRRQRPDTILGAAVRSCDARTSASTWWLCSRIVVVEKQDPGAVGRRQPGVARTARPARRVVVHDSHLGKLRRHHVGRAVARRLVDDQQLDIRPRLRLGAAQRLAQQIPAIAGGDDDRDLVAHGAAAGSGGHEVEA